MVEYAAVIAILIGALFMMAHYIKRGLGGKMRDSADSIGEQFDARNITSDMNYYTIGGVTTINSHMFEILDNNADSNRIYGARSITNTTAYNISKQGWERLGTYSTNLFQ